MCTRASATPGGTWIVINSSPSGFMSRSASPNSAITPARLPLAHQRLEGWDGRQHVADGLRGAGLAFQCGQHVGVIGAQFALERQIDRALLPPDAETGQRGAGHRADQGNRNGYTN